MGKALYAGSPWKSGVRGIDPSTFPGAPRSGQIAAGVDSPEVARMSSGQAAGHWNNLKPGLLPVGPDLPEPHGQDGKAPWATSPVRKPAGPRPSLAGLPAGAGRSAAGAWFSPVIMGAGWSPFCRWPGVSRWTRGDGSSPMRASHRFIYAQMARKKDYSWRHYLPRAKAKRGFRGRRGGSPATHIAHRVPLILAAGQHNGVRRAALERQLSRGERIGPGVRGPIPQHR